jgi:hypothetical protein
MPNIHGTIIRTPLRSIPPEGDGSNAPASVPKLLSNSRSRLKLPSTGNERAPDLTTTPASAARFEVKMGEFNDISAEHGIFSDEVEAFIRANADDEVFTAAVKGLQTRVRYAPGRKGRGL